MQTAETKIFRTKISSNIVVSRTNNQTEIKILFSPCCSLPQRSFFFFKRDSVSFSSSLSGGLIFFSLQNGESLDTVVSASARGRHVGFQYASLNNSARTTLACADRSFEERQ